MLDVRWLLCQRGYVYEVELRWLILYVRLLDYQIDYVAISFVFPLLSDGQDSHLARQYYLPLECKLSAAP